MKNHFLQTFIFILVVSATGLFAQPIQNLTDDIKKSTVRDLQRMLEDYVFPEKGRAVALLLGRNLKSGKYNSAEGFQHFARAINSDMYSVTNDKHLIIRYDPDDVAELRKRQNLSAEQKVADVRAQKNRSAKNNFGFRETKIFPANIGYLKMTEFEKNEFSKKTAAAAMEFISHSDAFIIDLRKNNGGWSNAVQYLCSYFFEHDDKNVENSLFEIHETYLDSVRKFPVLKHLPGKRIPDKPVYILTSGRTYSAAEKFADVLQKRKRGTIIGEQTRGGANSTRGPEILNDYFIVKMPTGRTINPVTNSNWEGIGVTPDISVNAAAALDTTLKIIVDGFIQKNSGERFVNSLGYRFLFNDQIEIAHHILKKNTELYPNSGNVWDSFGEVCLAKGDRKTALRYYSKSLELDPDNQNAKKMIKKLKKN